MRAIEISDGASGAGKESRGALIRPTLVADEKAALVGGVGGGRQGGEAAVLLYGAGPSIKLINASPTCRNNV